MVETKVDKFVHVAGLSGQPGQGPYMILALKVVENHVVQARYSTYGCSVAEACGQWVCDEVEGKALSYAATLDEKTLIRRVGNMPLAREHCPALAINALKHALMQL